MFIPLSRNSFHFLDQLERFLAYEVSISLLCCISCRKLSHKALPLSIRLTVRLYLPISQKLSLVACTNSSFSDISTTLWVPAHQQKEAKHSCKKKVTRIHTYSGFIWRLLNPHPAIHCWWFMYILKFLLTHANQKHWTIKYWCIFTWYQFFSAVIHVHRNSNALGTN